MLRSDTQIVVTKDGQIIQPFVVPPLEIQINTATFPTIRNNGLSQLRFLGTGTNTIYFDWGDGEITSIDFNNNWIWNSTTGYPTLKTFPNAATRIIKISFKYPSKLSTIAFIWMNFLGMFPKNIGLFKLATLTTEVCSFSSFPTTFKGGIFESFSFSQGTNSNYSTVGVPDGVLTSRIKDLILAYSFNLANSATNKLDRLIEISGLTNVGLQNTLLTNTSIPSNWKNITTLRGIGLGSNSGVNTIVQNITDCKQITTLQYGAGTGGLGGGGALLNTVFANWGTGIGGMSLTTLFCEGRSTGQSTEWTTAAITGLDTCIPLRNIWMRNVFITQAGIDAFIDNMYALITTIAPANSTVGAMRGVNIRLDDSLTTTYVRTFQPTGTYQAPTGFVLYSNNGSPTTPKEKIYVLNKNYKWTFSVRGATSGSIITYAP